MICEICGLEYETAGSSTEHIGCPGKKTKSDEREAKGEKQGEVKNITEKDNDEFKGPGIKGKK